ncbi:hypothetical protein DL98DRAFT_514349 [Cadophora sp. DSE1049]|nr:hypothetical protein DL98DRAFT_514349 [Cadophora sp. DSE1049]
MASPLYGLNPSPIARCHGYIDLTQLPRAESQRHRPFFRSTKYLSAVYMDFLTSNDEDEGVSESSDWRRYFRDQPLNSCLLRALVLELVAPRPILYHDFKSAKIFTSGIDGLKSLHRLGILHGDVDNPDSTVMIRPEERIIWLNLSSAHIRRSMKKNRYFEQAAAKEIKAWKALFSR